MSLLTFVEKQTIRRLFGIADGFVFEYLKDRGYNKNYTKELILESCGINIYEDEPYKDLSQQKCIEKIWDSDDPQTVANLLSGFLDYYRSEMGSGPWNDEDINDYRQVETIIEKLRAKNTVTLPQQGSDDLKLILEDIESNIRDGKPELVIDRLHTFSVQFFKGICRKHGIPIVTDQGTYISLDGLVGKLKKYYEQENYFDSEFCVVAIKNTINIFARYNELRNMRSAAHPNPLLQKAEAEYAVKVIADTLMFVDKIEKSKDDDGHPDYDYFSCVEEELPF